jgi:hypothetical protein
MADYDRSPALPVVCPKRGMPAADDAMITDSDARAEIEPMTAGDKDTASEVQRRIDRLIEFSVTDGIEGILAEDGYESTKTNAITASNQIEEPNLNVIFEKEFTDVKKSVERPDPYAVTDRALLDTNQR